jgi:2-polyprenyl-3-methyl-5-hydroxy-6-metoxy-1,4-benzoquinol methylase
MSVSPPPSPWHEARKRNEPSDQPLEMANRGTHLKVLDVLRSVEGAPENLQVLDIGAGMGALSAMLADAGYRTMACDLYPDAFSVPGIECRSVDASGQLPYDDQSIDIALAVEVLEHIDGHQALFKEVRRILKPGGLFLFTTPNIASLKSRWMFLFNGYPYSFPSLDPEVVDPVHQHITPFSLDRYRWRLRQAGLEFMDVTVDRYQSTSKLLMFLYPIIWLLNRKASRRSESVRMQNQPKVLLGRILLVLARRSTDL